MSNNNENSKVVEFPTSAENNTTLTEDQIEYIANEMEEAAKGTPSEEIAKFPSNNGVEETDPATREPGEHKYVSVAIDPKTGEHKILGNVDTEGLDDKETFEEMYDRIQNGEIEFDRSPVTEKELVSYISGTNNQSMIAEIADGTDLSPDTIKTLLDIVNRRMNKEEFNIYREFPEEVRKLVDGYLCKSGIPINTVDGRHFRNSISESLIDDFISNINMDRTLHDFNKELEDLFSKSAADIAESVIGYTEERNQKYREYAENMEDGEKKKQMTAILDQIDEAYALTTLKEFAAKCRIKKFDLEKPGKIYSGFLKKYEESSYNIYSIEMAADILKRNINDCEEEQFTDADISAFFVCFCKQCMNMSPEVVTEHAYMYYVIYNIVILDMNKGDNTKHVSDTYINNIKDVIRALKSRNSFLH